MTKILLVDDMANFLDLEISFLNRIDCETLIAKNGMEAIKTAKAEKPDIILLDLEMPVMNGIECCRILKNDPEMKKIPLIMVTSSSRMEECYKAGCDDFVKKPISEAAFLEEIRKFVEIREREDRRAPLSVEVSYSVGEESYFAYSQDISISGIFVVSRDLYDVGTDLSLNFKVDERIISCKGRVTRKSVQQSAGRQVSGMGIEFLDIEKEDEAHIRSYIERS